MAIPVGFGRGYSSLPTTQDQAPRTRRGQDSDNVIAKFFLIVSFLGIPFIAPACRGSYILLNEYAQLMTDHQKRTITTYYNMSITLLCFYGVCFLSGVLFNRISSKVLQNIMVFLVFLTIVLSIIFPAICLWMGGLASFMDIEAKIATIRQKNQTLIRYALVYNMLVLVIFSMVMFIVLLIDCFREPGKVVPFSILSYFLINPSCYYAGYFLQFIVWILSALVGGK